jgi:hypothetical protein
MFTTTKLIAHLCISSVNGRLSEPFNRAITILPSNVYQANFKTTIMSDTISYNIDEETISSLGLTITHKQVNAQSTPNARVFEYPDMEDVFIMENDLYGDTMPERSCFIAFNGRHGLVGRSLTIEQLKNLSVEEIKMLVASNSGG